MNRSTVENPRLMIENVENGLNNNRDYISSLPDDIISHILSRLRAKSAVQTCVLSKAWEYKWTTIYDIEIDDEECFSNNEKKLAFVNFVDRILFHSQNFRRFHLDSWEVYEASRVRAWLSIIFRRNVEEVTIHAFYGGSLPRSLLNCTSLRELEIEAQCYWKTPVNNRFPNLKSIFLREVHFVSEISGTGTLVFHFPVLEEFAIRLVTWLNVRFVEIHAPKLISFSSDTSLDDDVGAYTIKIFGASLQEFEIYGGYPQNFLLTGSTVSCAVLGNEDHLEAEKCGLQAQRLLKEFSSLKGLELSCYFAKCLAQTEPGLPLPKFDELEKLCISPSREIWKYIKGLFEGLFELLRSAPLLKSLHISLCADGNMDSDAYKDYDYNVMESVPSCVVSHLLEVKFFMFQSEIHQLLLLKFLLKNGAQLQKLTFCGNDELEKIVIEEQLQKFPKASTRLKVVFT